MKNSILNESKEIKVWNDISTQSLDIDFLEKYQEHINWEICLKNNYLSEQIIDKFFLKFNNADKKWFYMLKDINLKTLKKYKDVIDWELYSKVGKFNDKKAIEFKDYINWNEMNVYEGNWFLFSDEIFDYVQWDIAMYVYSEKVKPSKYNEQIFATIRTYDFKYKIEIEKINKDYNFDIINFILNNNIDFNEIEECGAFNSLSQNLKEVVVKFSNKYLSKDYMKLAEKNAEYKKGQIPF